MEQQLAHRRQYIKMQSRRSGICVPVYRNAYAYVTGIAVNITAQYRSGYWMARADVRSATQVALILN